MPTGDDRPNIHLKINVASRRLVSIDNEIIIIIRSIKHTVSSSNESNAFFLFSDSEFDLEKREKTQTNGQISFLNGKKVRQRMLRRNWLRMCKCFDFCKSFSIVNALNWASRQHFEHILRLELLFCSLSKSNNYNLSNNERNPLSLSITRCNNNMLIRVQLT